MKLKDLIIKLEEMNCIEQIIETKGELVNWKCDNNYNLPYKLKPILPYMKEKTIFNFMQDSRRGMWVNKVFIIEESVNKLVLIQFMFNREGDDNIFPFVINKELLIKNLYNLDCYMDEDEIERLYSEIQEVDLETYELDKFCESCVTDWLNYKVKRDGFK